jgi:hypothetical protein
MKITIYYVITSILLILGLLLIGLGQKNKANKVIVSGIVLMFMGLCVILVAYHQHEKFWAPPIDGSMFIGLANPGQMASANFASLLARADNCKECEQACKKCMRHPFDKKCYDSLQKCTKSKCNPNIKHVVNRDCAIQN